jgi:TonB family protein
MSFEPVKRNEAGLISVATLVIWLVCVIVGVLGYLLPGNRPKSPATQPAPTEAELVNVSLTDQQVVPPDQPPPPRSDAVPTPQVPEMPAVAAPSPAIAFALPVNAPVHVVRQAAVAPTQVFIGQTDGDEPKPDYPVEAQLAGEEGTVRIDFTVTPQGRITAARVATPCDWPLLNQSALRCVRDQWSFPAKLAGRHFVLIDFKQQ